MEPLSGCADASRARALGALLDIERDALAAVEAIEVQGRVQLVAVEEVVLAVLGGDETETAVSNDLLDGACGHGCPFTLPELKSRRTVRSRRGVDHAERRPHRATAEYSRRAGVRHESEHMY